MLAVIAAAAGRDCGYRCAEREKFGRTTDRRTTPLAICQPRDGHTDVAPAIVSSLFRFASVASKPRFSHDPVNLAPDCDG
ncbi:hypothetical protein ACH79_12035 [Bradyrhizobium sp. CCBAU 051011]|nr:hypothetical protein ACH79_12035 [Bradyrhizobium sp. CCBAU 051011]